MRLRTILAFLVAVFPVLVLTGSPASAQTSPCPPGGTSSYPPSVCGLALDRSTVSPGQPLTISGSGCVPNSTVVIRFGGSTISTVQSGANGAFTATVNIPANAAPGVQTITATCTDAAGAVRELRASVTVLGAQFNRPVDGGGFLPRTGSSSAVPAGIAGVVLVGVGSLAVVATRRRRTA